MNLKNKLNGNIIMAVVLLIGTTVYFVEALKLPVFVTLGKPGAGVFPLMLVAVMYIVVSVTLVRGIKQEKKLPGWGYLKIPAIAVGLIGIYVGTFYHLGYFGTTLLFSFSIALLFRESGGSRVKMLVFPLIIAVAATLTGYLLFQVIFDIRLPTGVW